MAFLLALGIVSGLGSAILAPSAASAATRDANPIAGARPMGMTSGYSGEQLANAAVIVAVARRMGLGREGAVVGVMTAMGESSLRNLDHGDGAINPDGTVADSVGLFQQQRWWGTLRERRTPAIAAARFFQRLRTVPDWQRLAPTAAAHAVQRNADPNHYTRFLAAAGAVVDAVHPAATRVPMPRSRATMPEAAGNALDLPDLRGIGDLPELPNLRDVGDVPDLPDLADIPDLPEGADVPDLTDLGGAGFDEAVLDELRESGVALPDEQHEAGR